MFPHLHGHIVDDYGVLVPLEPGAWHNAWVFWYYADFWVIWEPEHGFMKDW